MSRAQEHKVCDRAEMKARGKSTETDAPHRRKAAWGEADGGEIEVGVGDRGAQGRRRRRVVVVGPAHAHRDALKHDAVQRHRVGRLLHCAMHARLPLKLLFLFCAYFGSKLGPTSAELDESKLLLVVYVDIDDGRPGARGGAPNRRKCVAEEGGNILFV